MAVAKKRSRGRAPKPISPVSAFLHHFSWKWVVGSCVGLTAVLGLVVMYEKAHPIIEPNVPALRGYVRDHTAETTDKRLSPIAEWMSDYDVYRITQTMESARSNLTSLNQNLLLAKKEQAAAPDSLVLRQAIGNLEKEIRDTTERVADYEKALVAKKAKK